MKHLSKIYEMFKIDNSVDRHFIASSALTVLTTNHNGALPTEDVLAIFTEVESRLTDALEVRQKEIVHESELIKNFLKR